MKQKIKISTLDELMDFIANNPPPGVDLTLVGGQTVGFWRAYYEDRYPEEFKGVAASQTRDVDFVALSKDSKIAGEYWAELIEDSGYESLGPDILKSDNHDPRNGVMVVNIGGGFQQRMSVDFLQDLYKIPTDRLKKHRTEFAESIYVISEYVTLLNRINNFGLMSKRAPVHFEQLEEAIVINRCAVRYLLDENDPKLAARFASRLLDLMEYSSGRGLFRQFGKSLLSACNWLDPRFPEEFLEKNAKPRLKKIEQALDAVRIDLKQRNLGDRLLGR